MVNRKALVSFIVITFGIAWTLFLLPLAVPTSDVQTRQLVTLGLWSAAMWAPGLAALIVTRFVLGRPLRTLGLGRLGPKRYYLWAWLLPPLLALLAAGSTVLLGLGQIDPNLTLIRQSLANAPNTGGLNPWLIVGMQIVAALTLAPLINTVFALGEELGWRGFLLPELLPLGQARAITLSGIIWGVWHAPAIAQGHNYPGYPVSGSLFMIVFCILTGAIFSWLYLNTRSPWTPALAHGALNATAALPVMFMQGFDPAFGGTLVSVAGWLPLALFVLWLVWTRRLPVQGDMAESAASLAPAPVPHA